MRGKRDTLCTVPRSCSSSGSVEQDYMAKQKHIVFPSYYTQAKYIEYPLFPDEVFFLSFHVCHSHITFSWGLTKMNNNNVSPEPGVLLHRRAVGFGPPSSRGGQEKWI